MINVFLETERLFLEPLSEKHINAEYVSWLNDSEIVEFNRHGLFPNTINKTRQYVDSVNIDSRQIVLALIDKESQIHIGNVAIQNIDLINRHTDVSILIGKKEFWGKGYASEIYIKIFDHIFNSLNLNKVYLGTSAQNVSMQKIAQKLGMKRDGIKREALYKNGQFNDLYEYSILKSEYLDLYNE